MLLMHLSWKAVFTGILMEKVKLVRPFVELNCTNFIQEHLITLSLPSIQLSVILLCGQSA